MGSGHTPAESVWLLSDARRDDSDLRREARQGFTARDVIHVVVMLDNGLTRMVSDALIIP